MPKAAINKNCEPLRMEYEIWFAWELRMPPPSGNPGFAHKPKKRLFRGDIPFGTYARHIPRALFAREPISHFFLHPQY